MRSLLAEGMTSSFILLPSSFASVFFTLFGNRTGQFFDLWHGPADFFFNDLAQSDVRCAEIGVIRDERTTHATAASVQLTHTAGDDVDKYVGRANLFQSFFAEFSVHNLFQSKIERARVTNAGQFAMIIF